jgi:hypothetical protein
MVATEYPAGSVVPNFFLIGAPKCGTTALSLYLRTHPNIYFSRVKEPHFFDSDRPQRVKWSLEKYLSLFSKADPCLHKAVGEGSTGYLHSKVAVSHILKLNPRAKFIAMLRNPIDLVQAWHSQQVFLGIESIRNFERAWRLEGRRRDGESIPRWCPEPKLLFYSEWGKLGDQIERLFSLTDRNNVKVIMFDDFVADPRRIYEGVLEFLEVPSDGRRDFSPANENRGLRYPMLQPGIAFVAYYLRRFRAASGFPLWRGVAIFRRLQSLNSKPALRNSISPMLRAELSDFYREDIQKLSNLLHHDLSSFATVPSHKNGSPG